MYADPCYHAFPLGFTFTMDRYRRVADDDVLNNDLMKNSISELYIYSVRKHGQIHSRDWIHSRICLLQGRESRNIVSNIVVLM